MDYNFLKSAHKCYVYIFSNYVIYGMLFITIIVWQRLTHLFKKVCFCGQLNIYFIHLQYTITYTMTGILKP